MEQRKPARSALRISGDRQCRTQQGRIKAEAAERGRLSPGRPGHPAFQRGVLQLVTAGEGPTTQASREWLQKLADGAGPGEMPTRPKVTKAPTSAAASTGTVDRAVKALESKGLIAKTTKGWAVVDPLMRLWLQQSAPIVR